MTRAGQTRRAAVALACAVELVASPARAQEPSAPAEATPAASAQAPEPSASSEAPTGASASDQAAALAHFREGKRHYGERRYTEAAEAFARSLAAAWSIEAVYNMALSLDRASDLVAALQAYRAYLERADPGDAQRDTALERSELLRGRIGEVLLQIDSLEAIREIRINGVAVAVDAFPWLTLPGPLEVEFVGEAPGQLRKIRADVRPGGTATIVFPGFVGPVALPPDKPPPVVAPPKLSRRHRALRAGFWTTASLAAAGGVTVAALGSLTRVHERRANEGCNGTCEPGDTPPDRRRLAFLFQDATNVAVVISATLGVTALALGIALVRERRRHAASTRAAVRWHGTAVELTF